MIALVTGASSGLGRDMARSLARRGIDLIITARRGDRLSELKSELCAAYDIRVKCVTADLSDINAVKRLYESVRKYRIDILINNAGFGVFGEFTESSLQDELDMIDVNIKAMHTLFKLFLKDFTARGCGFILNTASAAGFLPGPWFSSYYASKAYIVRLTQAVAEELRSKKSGVRVAVLCPGPVATEFDRVANVRFLTRPYSSEKLAEHAIDELLRGEFLITENAFTKALIYGAKLVPDRILAFCAGLYQSKREGRGE